MDAAGDSGEGDDMATSGQESGDRPPVIDRGTLDGLETVLGTGRLRDFVLEYLEEADRLERAIRAAWSERDWDAVYRPAHDLVSSAGNFGAMRLSALADRLQQAARRREEEALEDALARLGEATEDAAAELRRLFEIS